MTKVVHFKKEKYDVYIGRPSKWGNPFSHKEGTLAEFKTGSRKEAVEKFEKYLISNKDLMKDLPSLKGKVLGCWCKKPSVYVECHGDVLADLANIMTIYRFTNALDAVEIYRKNRNDFIKNRKSQDNQSDYQPLF